MIKLLEEQEHYQKDLEDIRYLIKKALDENDYHKQRIKVLEEENIILQNEKNDLTGQLKVIKKITESY